MLIFFLQQYSVLCQTPNNWRTFVDKALVRLMVKDTSGAIERFQTIVKGSGDSAEAYLQRGLFYVGIRYYDSAMDDFATAIQKMPTNKESFLARGSILFERKQYWDALKDLNEAIVLDNDFTEAYYMHGLAAMRLQDYNAAAMDFADVLRLDSLHTNAHYQIAVIAIQQKRTADALSSLNTVLRLQPLFAEAYTIRAAALIDLGKAQEACPDLVEAVKLGNKSALEILRTQCGKYISIKGIDSLQTFTMEEVAVVGVRDEYARAAAEMKLIAARCGAVASVLANRVSGRYTSARGTRIHGLFANRTDTKPLIVGTGPLPMVTMNDIDVQGSIGLNLDDFIALTADRVVVSKNSAIQQKFNQVIQRRNMLRTFLDGQLPTEARGVIREIATEITQIAELFAKEVSGTAKN
jgi:tetratricopeptide (TPR) repeat protein